MRLNKLITLTLLLSSWVQCSLWSQNDEKHTELGFNMTQALSMFINNDNIQNSDVPFTIKRVKGNKATRYGFAFDLNLNTDEFRSLEDNTLSFRVGRERRKKIESWIDLIYGLDLFTQAQYVRSSSFIGADNISLVSTDLLIGPRAFIGCHFKISQRIAFEFELAFLLSGSYNRETTEFSFDPSQDFSENSLDYDFSMMAPQSFYLIIKLGKS